MPPLPDRIDFTRMSDDRVIVLKLRRDTADPQAPRDIPEGHDIKLAGFDLDAALAWCQANGYTVRRWLGGARAWLGGIWPIRTRNQIQRMRDNQPCAQMDFAYDG